jgi:hypothetical protein
MILKAALPILPNPLIATFTIVFSFCDKDHEEHKGHDV